MAETFELKLRIHNEDELYNPFDKDKKTLSSDVIDYLYTRYQEKGLFEKMVLHISSEEEIDVEKLRSSFQYYFESQSLKLKREKQANMLKQIWMFGIGVFFISMALYASDLLPAVVREIVSTIGAFSLWEAANIWIVENPGIRLRQSWLKLISKTELICDRVGVQN